jgi:hypothetical protein
MEWIGNASDSSDSRLEGNKDVQEKGEEAETDPTILDAALRLLSGELSQHDETRGQVATDPVLRFADR